MLKFDLVQTDKYSIETGRRRKISDVEVAKYTIQNRRQQFQITLIFNNLKKIMKKWALILVLASLTINCSNDDENSIKEQLIGKWIWVESSGGIQGETLNPQTTGENRHIEITSDKIKYFTNGILTSEFDYYLQRRVSIWTNEMRDFLIYKYDRTQSIVLSENKLILYDECFDCYQHEYIKE